MGATGCIRSWRLVRTIRPGYGTWSRGVFGVLWRELEEAGYINPVMTGPTQLRWHFRQGQGRPLYELTSMGKAWYQYTFDSESVVSELGWVLSHHVSARHAVAILEARDHLQDLGIPVDDSPPPCPERAEDPWGIRSEPDLAVFFRHRVWPVEVQRDIRLSNLSKWVKALTLFQRLILITFCTDRLARQCRMLAEARAQSLLPDFPILLSSLESWELGDKQFLTI